MKFFLHPKKFYNHLTKYKYGEKAKGHINTQREFSEQLFKSEIAKLTASIQNLRDKFGIDILKSAGEL